MPFANGENVGTYRIVEKLGQGGMATVYKAYHPALDRYVAIKVMHPAFMEDPNFLARFQREARIVAKLDHPHIVPIYDFAEHRGHPYLVMRFVEGETLKARMERASLEPQEVLRTAKAVGEALAYAHGQGVLHRDIKPSNILLTPEGGVYLTDFGLARMAEAGESTLSRDMMVGTPQYISPEQAKGVRELDARTDVYSLGVVLYETLVGQAPFTADTPYAIIHDHIFTPLPLPRELNPNLPDPLQRVLLKALSKEPEDRFQSVKALINALETTLQPDQPTNLPETVVAPSSPQETGTQTEKDAAEEQAAAAAEKPKKPGKKKRRWWIAAAGAIFICLMAFMCLVVANQGKQRRAQKLLEEARMAVEEENPEDALDLYRQAVEANPHLVSAYVEASELLVRAGDVDQAIDTLLAGVEANPDNAELHVRAAGTAIAGRRLDEARRETDWLLQEMPQEALPHAYAGLLTLLEGRPCAEAHPELDEALQIDPELAWAHHGLAMCFIEEGNPEKARGELEFVVGQENAPPFLRRHAEEMLDKLGEAQPGGVEPIEREFEALFPLLDEIPDDDLRMQFQIKLEQVSLAWEQGHREDAIHSLKDARIWVREHQDGIGVELTRELTRRLENIIRLATES